MKPTFLSIQATYAHVHIALFKDNVCVEHLTKNEAHASSHLLVLVEHLLTTNKLSITDLDFIAIDKGPGAFTSLRVAIATVNGIAFARHIPLMGVDSLDALTYDVHELIKQNKLPPYHAVLALLNAYNNDVYYAFSQFDATTKKYTVRAKGCHKIDHVITQVVNQYAPTELIGTGSGCAQHLAYITQMMGTTTPFYHHPQATPRVESIGNLGLEIFLSEQQHTYKIEPLYLKSQLFAITGQKKNS